MADGDAGGGGGGGDEQWPIAWFAVCDGYPGFQSVVVFRYLQAAPFAPLVRDPMPCGFGRTAQNVTFGLRLLGVIQENVATTYGFTRDDYLGIGAPELVAEWVVEVWL